jgi:hypothetical protein
MSHGCNIVGGEYFTGWPNYAVDAPAVSHRIMPWLSFRYRVTGELYYNMVEAYARGLDPWKNQLLFGGNGDGTLFYPGRARSLGGAHDFPVESLRLMLIREGLEDYEYLTLYKRLVGQKEADALAASIAKRTFQWEHDPDKLMAARRRIALALDLAATRSDTAESCASPGSSCSLPPAAPKAAAGSASPSRMRRRPHGRSSSMTTPAPPKF